MTKKFFTTLEQAKIEYPPIPLGQAKDISKNKYGKLTPIYRTINDKNKKAQWICQCDCGNIILKTSRDLISGNTKSCGCLNIENLKTRKSLVKIELLGQKFGKLTVIAEHPIRKDGCVQWICQCECGNLTIVSGTNLKRGKVKSCGCLLKETGARTRKNLIGKRFGKLTVIKLADEKKKDDTHAYWYCDCDCGTKNYLVKSSDLVNGYVVTCGCGTREKSLGEIEINNILTKNSIKFEEQKTFDTCRFPNSNAKARFDFYLPWYNLLIEFDGEQHFEKGKWETDKDNLEKRQYRDNYKNLWCKANNILLIRIPYTQKGKIKLEDLLPGSNFTI